MNNLPVIIILLGLSRPILSWYRNQRINLLSKLINWFLHSGVSGLKWVNQFFCSYNAIFLWGATQKTTTNAGQIINLALC